ncbi:MAG: PP2C family protein-serine/threonine phosphatase, partial [Anaerolineae bacterium]
NTGEIKELADAGGLIIGFIDNLKFEAARQRLRPGQLLVFFTDGVTEAQNPCEELFGQERLRAVIREQADKDGFYPEPSSVRRPDNDCPKNRRYKKIRYRRNKG